MISRKTLGGALDGDVNLKIGILMVSMFFGCFCGSNIAGVLIDRLGKLKIIGILAISGGKIIRYDSYPNRSNFLKPFSPLLDSNMLSSLGSHFGSRS